MGFISLQRDRVDYTPVLRFGLAFGNVEGILPHQTGLMKFFRALISSTWSFQVWVSLRYLRKWLMINNISFSSIISVEVGRWVLPNSIHLKDVRQSQENEWFNPKMIVVWNELADSRVNMYMGLTVMQEVWMREHNRITDYFIKLNPHWSDDRLYEESRKITIGIMQHITYNEFVPLLLGKQIPPIISIPTSSWLFLLLSFYCFIKLTT